MADITGITQRGPDEMIQVAQQVQAKITGAVADTLLYGPYFVFIMIGADFCRQFFKIAFGRNTLCRRDLVKINHISTFLPSLRLNLTE